MKATQVPPLSCLPSTRAKPSSGALIALQHEIKGLAAYIKYALTSRFPDTLHFPLMTVIGRTLVTYVEPRIVV